MNSRKIVEMFFKTLLYGGLVGLSTSFIVKYAEYQQYISPFDGRELLGVFLFFLGYALVFTVVSQTGFFAYLFIHRFGQNFFKTFWPTVQLLVIAFVLFDLIYFTSKEIPLIFKWSMMLLILITGLIVGRVKVKQTNRTAFVPALFCMVVVTALQLSLVLRAADTDFIILMLVTVLFANAYQLIILYEVTKVDKAHQMRIAERRKARITKKLMADDETLSEEAAMKKADKLVKAQMPIIAEEKSQKKKRHKKKKRK